MMGKHFLPNGDAVETLGPQTQVYTLYRIYDKRLDPEPKMGESYPHIYVFSGTSATGLAYGERKRLDAWILDENLEWHRKDPKYWRHIYKRAEAETFIPGMCVFEPREDGTSQHKRDEVSMYWKRLCWCGLLPIGEPDIWDSQISGFDPEKVRDKAYWGPRTAARWIRGLRFWIRREQRVLDAGSRRTLGDYPLLVRTALKLAIKLMTKDLDCVDNIRFAQTRKPGEMRRFRRAEKEGCCGSTNRYVIVGTQQYIIGCNYGH